MADDPRVREAHDSSQLIRYAGEIVYDEIEETVTEDSSEAA